jgi:hypothetical protein
MSLGCTEEFRRLADQLGGIDCEANPVLSIRAPWHLQSWTLAVVEILMIGGAVLALVHATTMLRRNRQPAWLCLWLASVMYVIVLEPPLYFPESFGLGDRVGLTFVHNVFSVEFLYDRLPLYIVALYPAGIYLAHALVDRLGVFRRRGIVVGAVTAGAVHHLFYEIFDHLGPQLRWWAWNPAASSNSVKLASVPLTSMVIFAAISPALLIGLGRWLLFRNEDGRRGRGWAWRTLTVGVLTPLLTPLVTLPLTLVLTSSDVNETVARIMLEGSLAIMAIVALSAIVTSRPIVDTGRGLEASYPILHAAIYLATFALLWITALPALFGASNRLTESGTPIGNPLYALGCAAVGTWCVVRIVRARLADDDVSPTGLSSRSVTETSKGAVA